MEITSYEDWKCPPRATLKAELHRHYPQETAAPIRELGTDLIRYLKLNGCENPLNQFWELTRAPEGNLALEHLVHLKFFEHLFAGDSLKILDLCCGNGEFSFFAKQRGHSVTATAGTNQYKAPENPLPTEAQDFARRRRCIESLAIFGIQPQVLVIEDFKPTGLPANSFDVIYVNQCTIHFPLQDRTQYWSTKHWAYFLEDLTNSLTPRGIIFLTIGNPSDHQISPYMSRFSYSYEKFFPEETTCSWWPLFMVNPLNRHLVPNAG